MHHQQHLKSLREWMNAHNVQALLVPHEDMFGGEYIAAHDERLAWISGFTGSAGLAIITHDKTHLFVDGRYTLQAKAQSPDFTIHDFTKAAIDAVCKNLPSAHTFNGSPDGSAFGALPGMTQSFVIPAEERSDECGNLNGKSPLHYDPWLLSVRQLEEWKQRTTMCVLEKNPIDLLWSDRPAPLHKPAYIYPLEYAGVSAADKLKVVRADIAKHKAEAWLLSNSESVCWLLNIRGEDLPYTPLLHCMALVTDTAVTLFCEPTKISPKMANELSVHVVNLDEIKSTLKSVKGTICADKRTTSAVFGDINFSWQTDPCELKKAIKNATEQQGMRNCHARDAVALMRFWMWLEKQQSITEMEAQDYLETCRQQLDLYKGDSFATISGFGPHGAIVHYRSTAETNIPISKGMYLLDSGGQYLDGTTDITRTFYIGEPTKEQKEHYTLVLKGHIALAHIRFPKGTTGAQLDSLARQFLWNHGLDYAHGTGHGVGSYLNVHEGPQGINKIRQVPLEVGMVVSNEPGFYRENQYGIRIENLQMVKEAEHSNFLCFESLTLVPYESALIDYEMLSKAELNWLAAYYQNIWETVSPMLNEHEQEWLKKKLSKLQ